MKQTTSWLVAACGLALAVMPGMTGAQGRGAEPVSAGERAFRKCFSCHALGDTDEGAQGPSLKGVVGRKVASWPGYDYSPSVRSFADKQPRWTREALDAFLADPHEVVPGNEMGFFGLRDAEERAALIDYLATR
jgi:cytochrome c